MKYELIKKMEGLEMYGDIPALPVELDNSIGERFIGEESDSWLLLDHLVKGIDKVCPNLLDYGDVDFFDGSKCIILKKWLEENKGTDNPRLNELYHILYDFICRAIEMKTGVVIEL